LVKMRPDSVISPAELVPYEHFPFRFDHASAINKRDDHTAASVSHTDEDIQNLSILCHTLETVGAPVQLAMEVVGDEDIIQIEISVLDACGRRVTSDQSRVNIHIDGDCEYLGLDNGDVRDVTDYRAFFRNALEGRLMLYLRKKGDAAVTVRAGSPYLRHCSLIL
ncbi:MAG: hypothetical protein K2N94_01275, partial [Lachnospiraceae bacterium]|nr:hypothetical protein [Lachnospiraceae bacterium]